MDENIVFKALADPTRRLILDEFTERKEQTLYELSARLAVKHKIAASRQAIAKHIGVLENAGLLRSEHRGKYRVLITTNKFNERPDVRKINDNSDSTTMRIILTSIFVEDQLKALKFYTETLGFLKKQDTSVGEFRWLTVVSPDDQDGTELLLEPSENPIFQNYKKALVEQGIPAAMFGVNDIEATCSRLEAQDVAFMMKPTQMGDIKIAVFDDTCGNLIQLIERREDRTM